MKEPVRFDLPSDEDVLAARFSGVAIDDTGTPGHKAASVHLHPDRKTWVAVLLPPDEMALVSANLGETIALICGDLGVDELHFTEIYNGKGPLRDLPIDRRFNAFEMFAKIFQTLRLPVIVQTKSPDDLRDASSLALKRLGKVAGVFDMEDASDHALVMLFMRVRRFVELNSNAFHKPAIMLMDEGRFKAGSAVQLRTILNFAHQEALFVASSNQAPLLQLADFAAFALNRMQWLLAKEERSARDELFMDIVAKAEFQGIDMAEIAREDARDWTTVDFDITHEMLRMSRGVHPIPGQDPESRENSKD